jgi:hypothetical protein
VTLTLTAKGFAALKFIVQSHSASALAAGLFSLAVRLMTAVSRFAGALREPWLTPHQSVRRAAKFLFECSAEMGNVGETKTEGGVGHLPNAAFCERFVTCGEPLLPKPAYGCRTLDREQAM